MESLSLMGTYCSMVMRCMLIVVVRALRFRKIFDQFRKYLAKFSLEFFCLLVEMCAPFGWNESSEAVNENDG